MKKNLMNTTKKWFFSLLFIMAVTYISSYILIVIPALKQVKMEKHKQDINKLVSMTTQQFDNLSGVLKNNAEWDILYKNMDGSLNPKENQTFLNQLFKGNILKLFDLDYIGIYDGDQNEIINYTIPEKNIKKIFSLKDKKYFFSSQTNGKNKVKMVSGYINIDEKAYMFFSHMILNSNGLGNLVGHLLFIEEIDDNYISNLKIKNNLLLELYIPNENEDNELIKKIVDHRKNLDFYSQPLENNKRVYYIPYMKSSKKIAYTIKVIVDDGISNEALLSFFIGMTPILILILFVFIMKDRLNKKLVNPLTSLYKHIISIKENKKYELLKYSKVGNEMDEVVEAFNKLMIRLEEQKNDIKNKKAALEKLAYIDHLTGLSSRRFLDEGYELLFQSAKRTESTLTLIMMDIDFFKKYNDNYGHPKGDKVLKIIGRLLKKTFRREGDIVSRYGGEEFLIVLYQTPLKEALRLVNEFQNKLTSCNIEHKYSHFGKVTVSIGIKSSNILKTQNSYIFLEKVDEALYRAKESGRNKYILDL